MKLDELKLLVFYKGVKLNLCFDCVKLLDTKKSVYHVFFLRLVVPNWPVVYLDKVICWLLVSCCPVDSLNCTKEDLTVSVAIDGLEQEVRLSAEHDMDEAKVGFGEIQLFSASLLHLHFR